MTHDHTDTAPLFLADHPALDFLNSWAAGRGEPREWLGSGRELLAWLEAAQLLDGEDLAHWQRRADEVDATAAKARELREWLRTLVEAQRGRPLAGLDARALAPLNAVLATDDAYRLLQPGAQAPQWQLRRRWSAPDQLLLPVADIIGDLLTQEDFAMVKQCEGAGCSLTFLDRTRAHSRRWCSMALCGNRSKVAAFRAKKAG